MSNRTAELQHLLDADAEYCAWSEEHQRCESRLHELTAKSDISTDEEFEEKTLKKRKLHLKDQMAERVRSYEASNVA